MIYFNQKKLLSSGRTLVDGSSFYIGDSANLPKRIANVDDIPDISSIAVIDNLTSQSSTDALSANQGRLLYDTINSASHLIPSGVILMWSGSADNIPSGWLLCDGSNGTPPLQDRFIVGAGSAYQVNDTGGAESVTLSSSQIPSHTHSVSLTAASNGGHTHGHTFGVSLNGLTAAAAGNHAHAYTKITTDYARGGNGAGFDVIGSQSDQTTGWSGEHTHTIAGSASLTGSISSGGAHTHSVSGNTGSTGNGGSHENRPPYYALCFIMKE